MNELTKDELSIILLEMNISIQRTPKQLKVSPVFIALRDKIELLIDNYCEHVNDPHFNALPIRGNPKMCTNCNEFYL